MSAALDRSAVPLSAEDHPHGASWSGYVADAWVYVRVTPSEQHPGYWDIFVAAPAEGGSVSTRRPVHRDFVAGWLDAVHPGLRVDRWIPRDRPDSDPRREYVYFIQAGASGPIKIGTAGNPVERLTALQTASPYRLRILTTIPGGIALERDLHRRFHAARMQGEWFKPTVELRDYITAHAVRGLA